MKRAMLFGAVALLTVAGCAGTKPELDDTFSDLAGADEKSDKFTGKFSLVGSLDYGQTSAAVAYKNPPKYRAFKFGGSRGDVVDIDVTSTKGDAVTFLLDNAFNIVAKNDDASASTLDSHITATLPGNRNPDIVTYYIAFRDYNLKAASFKVTLKGQKVDVFACGDDSDCTAVTQGGCCPNCRLAAVNKDLVSEYYTQTQCPSPRICPLACFLDTRVAECNATSNTCEMVAKIPCGGIAGLQCPAGRTCVDDPTDGCDPTTGGADCMGQCKKSCPPNRFLCIQGSHYDNTPGVCGCVPDAVVPSCDAVRCAAGTSCQICKTLTGPAPVCLPNGSIC